MSPGSTSRYVILFTFSFSFGSYLWIITTESEKNKKRIKVQTHMLYNNMASFAFFWYMFWILLEKYERRVEEREGKDGRNILKR